MYMSRTHNTYIHVSLPFRDFVEGEKWLPWLAHDEAPGPYITIPQYQFNKTKQHNTHFVKAGSWGNPATATVV